VGRVQRVEARLRVGLPVSRVRLHGRARSSAPRPSTARCARRCATACGPGGSNPVPAAPADRRLSPRVRGRAKPRPHECTGEWLPVSGSSFSTCSSIVTTSSVQGWGPPIQRPEILDADPSVPRRTRFRHRHPLGEFARRIAWRRRTHGRAGRVLGWGSRSGRRGRRSGAFDVTRPGRERLHMGEGLHRRGRAIGWDEGKLIWGH
jgi:hypothetical protein